MRPLGNWARTYWRSGNGIAECHDRIHAERRHICATHRCGFLPRHSSADPARRGQQVGHSRKMPAPPRGVGATKFGSADLFFKVCGFSHRPCPKAADLQNRCALLARCALPAMHSLDRLRCSARHPCTRLPCCHSERSGAERRISLCTFPPRNSRARCFAALPALHSPDRLRCSA